MNEPIYSVLTGKDCSGTINGQPCIPTWMVPGVNNSGPNGAFASKQDCIDDGWSGAAQEWDFVLGQTTGYLATVNCSSCVVVQNGIWYACSGYE